MKFSNGCLAWRYVINSDFLLHILNFKKVFFPNNRDVIKGNSYRGISYFEHKWDNKLIPIFFCFFFFLRSVCRSR